MYKKVYACYTQIYKIYLDIMDHNQFKELFSDVSVQYDFFLFKKLILLFSRGTFKLMS